MASIRKFRGKFNVQIRRQGYPSISRTFANLTTVLVNSNRTLFLETFRS